MRIEIKAEILQYKIYLLLQGPKGFFFYKLAKFLRSLGKIVYKINFNGGDLLTFPSFKFAINYRGKLKDFDKFIEKILLTKNIEAVILWADYRPYHKVAIEVCKKYHIPVYVFEEGYVRPDYITLERNGINGWSEIPKDPNFYLNLPKFELPPPLPANHSYLKRIISRVIHYFFLELLRWYFPNYVPYRRYFPYIHVVYCFLRGITFRKLYYKLRERKIFASLKTTLKGKYFLVPLQVFNDSQVVLHSNYNSIEEFIEEVIKSFAKEAPKDVYLVFKHHPEDRGFKNYEKFIKKTAQLFEVSERVLYIHDFHLPTLIKGSRGVVVINSTVGLQALFHNKPVKVLGRAVYDIPGITYQKSLDEFWKNPGQVDKNLFIKFRNYLILTTQLNGNFYGRFPFSKEILSIIKS